MGLCVHPCSTYILMKFSSRDTTTVEFCSVHPSLGVYAVIRNDSMKFTPFSSWRMAPVPESQPGLSAVPSPRNPANGLKANGWDASQE